jgi:hypothetical protein
MEASDPRNRADAPPPPRNMASLLAALEEISRGRPDRVLRLRGHLAVDGEGMPIDSQISQKAPSAEPHEEAAAAREPFELLLFRGFSSSVTHATAFDPDHPALPEGAVIETAELLAGPLHPHQECRLSGPDSVDTFLSPVAWDAVRS